MAIRAVSGRGDRIVSRARTDHAAPTLASRARQAFGLRLRRRPAARLYGALLPFQHSINPCARRLFGQNGWATASRAD